MTSTAVASTYLSPNLERVQTRSRGNTLVASRPILPGELLLVERPAVAVCFQADDNEYSNKCTMKYPSTVSQLAVQVVKEMQRSEDYRGNIGRLCSNLPLRSVQDNEKIQFEARRVHSIIRGGDLSVNDIIEVVDKLMANVFTITASEMAPIGVGLYFVASTINHSCIPNATQSFQGNTLSIRATHNIKPGEEVLISYIDVGQPTHIRRAELMESYQFYCSCRKCCVADPCEGFRCFTAACNGICRMSVDLSWLKFKCRTALLPKPRVGRRTWQHLFPFIDDLEGMMITISREGLLDEKDCAKDFACAFICSKCDRSIQLGEWVASVNRISMHRSKEASTISWAQEDVKLLRSILFDNCYLVMESLNSLLLKLIQATRYEEALTISEISLPCFELLYPKVSILISIQYFQHSKLLAYRGDIKRALQYVNEALCNFGITCGTDYSLYRDAEEHRLSLLY